MMKFNLPQERTAIIKVIGIGGGGGNAVNHMFQQGIKGVDFLICNTDQQALDVSPIPTKLQLGDTLTGGLGAGSNPETGKNSAIESIDDVKEMLAAGTKMVFVTAGMGGGTGTGAGPVVAKAAREMGILTVGIVTMPFAFEGRKRRLQAEEGIQEMRDNVDTLLVINNDRLREMYGNLTIDNAFAQADNVLTSAAKGIAETITRVGKINVDFNDIQTVMKDSGVAIMGSATSSGEDRSIKAVQEALASPLLNDNKIQGAQYVLLNITYGSEQILMDEITEITDYIQDEAGLSADIIWGHGEDDSLEPNELNITLIATGFNKNTEAPKEYVAKKPERKVLTLDEDVNTNLTQPVAPLEKPEVEEEKAAELDEPVLKTELETTAEEETPVVEEPSFKPLIGQEKPEEPVDETPTAEVDESPSWKPAEPEVKSKPETPVAEVEETPMSEALPETPDAEAPRELSDDDVQEYDEQTTIEFELKKPEAPKDPSDVVKYDLMSDEPVEPSAVTPDEPFIKAAATDQLGEMNTPKEESDEPTLKAEESSEESTPTSETPELNNEERQARAQERMNNLKNISMRLKSPTGISEMENQPAFVRRQIELEDTPHSSESQMSKYTLSENEDEDGNKSTEIKPNNKFLHDNVD